MSSQIVIEVKNVTKLYKLYDNPLDRLKESFHPFKKHYHHEFYALRDVSFDARKGEVVGIIGKNGSGKSTLLQIITGVLTPSSGIVQANGKISALLELGAGFNPELSGIENIYFKSSLLGFSRDEVDDKLDEILGFADIGDFVYQPVKTYSSGMYVRLAFAVAINVDPEILIIDEALSVGDFRFQQKCLRKVKKFKEENRTILFVSHSTHSVIEFCDRAIWLADGKINEIGKAKSVCNKYLAHMSAEEAVEVRNENAPAVGSENKKKVDAVSGSAMVDGIDWQLLHGKESFGELGAAITGVCLCRVGDGRVIRAFEGGERVIFYVKIKVKTKIEQVIVGFHLCDSRGVHILGMNTITLGVEFEPFLPDEERVVGFEFYFPFLHVGVYSFSPAIASGSQWTNIKHHWVHDASLVEIQSTDDAQRLGHYLVIKKDVVIHSEIQHSLL